MTDTNPAKFKKLVTLLKELFQLDQPDLDFGIYRIMHAKAGEVTQFLERDLLPQVKDAFAHWLNRCGGTDEKGEEKSSWMRVTAGYRRIKGSWRIVHEHFSAPFDIASGKAMFGLEP